VVRLDGERTPGSKLALAIGIAFLLSIPLFSIYLLNYGRQSESAEATQSITSGWGGTQTIGGPVLVIPYHATTTTTAVENGQTVTRTMEVARQLTLAPEAVDLATDLTPQLRSRSIYQAVVYQAAVSGKARFTLPPDLARSGINPAQMDLTRAELRFAVSDPRGLGANPRVSAGGTPLRLQPRSGGSSGRGFFGLTDASALAGKPLVVDFAYDIRGNEALSLAPLSGDTRWSVRSAWRSPSFGGDFLPGEREVTKQGFRATYRIGNLALGRSLIDTGEAGAAPVAADSSDDAQPKVAQPSIAQINLMQPVDVYSQVDRATKYGFLFIGFTFLALLMFDVIGGVRVSSVEYLLMGAALVLFFVLLLAFAEVIGFTFAYVVASAAIAGLNTAYSAAVLGSWRRATFIGALLIGLYAVLYVLISLEAYSLLIGSLLLFAALAGVMYGTRRIDWGGGSQEAA
jgi:inner membrane protein